ncbi:MAG: DUF222 domain-containing protein [Actinomycetota bacterium]
MQRAATAVTAARAAFADADTLARCTHQELVDLLTLTAELARVVDAQRVRLAGAIAERSRAADDASICRLLGSRNARDAVGRAFGIRTRDAAELLSLAAATAPAVSITGAPIATAFPRVAEALDAGAVSLAQARAIVGTLAPAATRADLSQLAWAEGCLVDEAAHVERRLAPELLVTQAQAYVAVLDPDGVLPESERLRALRSLRMRQRPDGSWLIVVHSTAEGGAALKAVVDAVTAPRVDVRFTDDAEESAEPARDADAPTPVDDRSLEQKRHDALIAMAEAHAASGGAPVAGGEVPRLVLTGTIEAFNAYLHDVEHADRTLTVEHTGSVVPIETVDRLLCNGVVQRAVTDARGHVLELGRTVRLFTQPQRRALAAQYRGCATPGCGFPVAWTETHHVVWWQSGGPTDVANGILLCSHCHHEVHAGRLLVVGSPGDWRVVAQLRPADPYARNTRSVAPPCEPVTAASAAAAPLAVKLPELLATDSSPAPDLRSAWDPSESPVARRPRGADSRGARSHGSRSPIEGRMHRRRSRDGRRRSSGATLELHHPSRHVLLRC